MAFRGFADVFRSTFADPVFTDCRADPRKCCSHRVMRGFIHGPGQPKGQDQGGFRFKGKVCQHIPHQGLVDQFFLKGASMACVVNGLDQCLAQQ